MAGIVQAPVAFNLTGVANFAFSFILDLSLSDSSTASSPVVTVARNGIVVPEFAPTITAGSTNQWTLSWTAAQTNAMQYSNGMSYAFSATVDGAAKALMAGTLTFSPDTTPGTATGTTQTLTVDVNGVTVDLSIQVGATLANIDGGSAATTYLLPQVLNGGNA